jgi:hypothetical protein
MAEQCFQKKGSNPPVCCVHNVRSVRGEVPIDRNATHLGIITSDVCPVSGAVAQDSATQS